MKPNLRSSVTERSETRVILGEFGISGSVFGVRLSGFWGIRRRESSSPKGRAPNIRTHRLGRRSRSSCIMGSEASVPSHTMSSSSA